MKRPSSRQRIVETAAHLFYQNGYNRTGINEIIEKAGIAKATLYSHFASKEDICLAYLQYKNAFFLQEITAFVAKANEGRDQILALFDFLNAFYGEKDFNGCWCINTVSEIPRENAKIRGEIQGQKVQLITLIENLLAGNFPGGDHAETQLKARQIYLLYEGAISESYLHQDNWPIASARGMCANLLI